MQVCDTFVMQVAVERSDTAMKTWVLVLTSIASFMVALDALVVATALSRIHYDPRWLPAFSK